MAEDSASRGQADDEAREADGEELQFDQAEYATSAPDGPSCGVCKRPIDEQYFEINGKVCCATCRQQIEAAFRGGSGLARAIKALIFGSVAAIAGAALYYAIVRATGYNFGLVAVVVGFMVGGAVRKGTGSRGGLFYQFLALFLAYVAIGLMQVSMALGEWSPPPSLLDFLALAVSLIFWVIALPVMAVFADPIYGLICSFALWEAWRLNKAVKLAFNGPFRVGKGDSSAPAPEDVDDAG